MRARFVGATGSALVHLCIALQFVHWPVTPPPPKPPVPTDIEVRGAASLRALIESEGALHEQCRGEEYIGLGVKYTPWNRGYVTGLAPNGPAAKAGIRVGDYVLNESDIDVRGLHIGQKVHVRLGRGGRETMVEVIVDRICAE